MTSNAYREVFDVQEHGIWPALQSRDVLAWEHILADNFVYRSPGEPDLDKQGFIQRIMSFTATILTIDSEDLRVDVYGDTAIVTGVQRAVIELPSRFVIEDFTMLNNVFVRREGRWLVVLSHAMNLPA
jgi:ketosteroid isomerase-like protein